MNPQDPVQATTVSALELAHDHDLPPLLPPVTCRPWCEFGDGHPRARWREDQGCLGVQRQVFLSTEPEVMMCDGTTRLEYVSAAYEQGADDVSPRITIEHGEGGGDVYLTLGEAERFAREILALVEQAKAL